MKVNAKNVLYSAAASLDYIPDRCNAGNFNQVKRNKNEAACFMLRETTKFWNQDFYFLHISVQEWTEAGRDSWSNVPTEERCLMGTQRDRSGGAAA